MKDKLSIGTRIRTINIDEAMTDIYGVPNNATGVIVGYGDSDICFYKVDFDERYVGSTITYTLFLGKDNVKREDE